MKKEVKLKGGEDKCRNHGNETQRGLRVSKHNELEFCKNEHTKKALEI